MNPVSSEEDQGCAMSRVEAFKPFLRMESLLIY